MDSKLIANGIEITKKWKPGSITMSRETEEEIKSYEPNRCEEILIEDIKLLKERIEKLENRRFDIEEDIFNFMKKLKKSYPERFKFKGE